MSESFIPNEKLLDGFLKEIKHIEQLLEASKQLHESKFYGVSIAISILAFEELPKLRLIETRLRESQPIKKQEWLSIVKGGSHNLKLVKLFEDSRQQVISMGEEHHTRVQKLHEKLGDPSFPSYQKILTDSKKGAIRLRNLNKIKQDCLYLNWKNSEWLTFSQTYSLLEQELVSEVLIIQNHLLFFDIILEYKIPSVSINEKSIKFQKYRDDSVRKKQVEILKQTESNEFRKKIAIAQKIVENYS